ncbi:hypothetical protein BH24ACT26_BH24ACT26_16390 [soil metagenome]
MTDFFLVFLGGAWLVVLWPRLRRAKRSTPLFTTERWRRGMELIAPRRGGSGRWIMAPGSSGAADRSARRSFRRTQRRRKRALLAVLATVPVSLIAALLLGGALWEIHLSSYAALAVYVALLVESKRRREESTTKVRSLASRRRPLYEWSASGDFEERRA